ncbi:unnamed protein product [Rhizoctonia solani]|uniref:C2H2-type domain-containing protein n=1 Tax=Rhizoctonia solani TaxID=456999 RepID=A0A8H2ZVS9_9AGAM|nr:unnamed protein product [Rhizoctonia solani]
MSHSQNSSHDSTYYGSGSGINTAGPGGDLPPFQSFPAARDSRSRPNPGNAPSQQDPAVAHGSSQRYQTVDDPNIRRSSYSSSTDDPTYRERQRTTTLPEFTPFPSASPSHRYAPPEGARAPQIRPIPPPAYVPETSTSYLPVPPPDVIRVPSGLPPGQPSPYAPPGPLTARPHVCEHCDSGFARAHDLKRHLETHNSERPHRCPNCQRSFSRKDAVQRHLVVTQCTGSGSSK